MNNRNTYFDYELSLNLRLSNKDPTWDYWEHESEVKMGVEDPVIVHFTTSWKPWFTDLRFPHPYRNTFFKYQSQTKWKNYSYDRRSLYMKIINYIGDVLRKLGVKKRLGNIFNEIPPID